MIVNPGAEVAHCTKILWSSESDIGECEGEKGEKRKASHREGEDWTLTCSCSVVCHWVYIFTLCIEPKGRFLP